MKLFQSFAVVLAAAFLFSAAMPPEAAAQNAGRLRAMKERAEKVTQMKNSFVVRVLKSYDIPYKLTPSGVVGALKLENRWVEVNQIDIVPVAEENATVLSVTGHEIFFYTEDEIIHLVSSLIVR